MHAPVRFMHTHTHAECTLKKIQHKTHMRIIYVAALEAAAAAAQTPQHVAHFTRKLSANTFSTVWP